MSQKRILDEKKSIKPKPIDTKKVKKAPSDNEVSHLQQIVGNRAVQRLISQRSEEGSAQLDEENASRINQERGGGQPLEAGVQKQMESAFDIDFEDVRVHASPEADSLSEELGAKAFTTGQDIFFRQDAYDPHTSGGQKLIAHELTHVVQQGSGAVNHDGGGMTVNAPGDSFEQEADAIAQTVHGAQTTSNIQRQDEEEDVQMQPLEEEEEEMQMQEEEEEEEETLQMQEEEEEELMP